MQKFRASFLFKLLTLALGLCILPGAMYVAVAELEKSGFFNVDQIHIVIEETPESPQYLQPWVKALDDKLEVHRGKSLAKLDLNAISEMISKEGWVQEVSLTRKFPSQLQISLKPKIAQGILLTKSGQYRPVVADGGLLGPIDPRFVPDLPLLAGDEFEKKDSVRQKGLTAIQEIPEEGSFSRKKISEVHFDAKEGLWMTLMQSGVKVKIGEENIALKSARVAQVLDYISAQNFEARVIDANLSKKVLVRLRKDP